MTPTCQQIREKRHAVGLTQAKAAKLLFTTANVWSQWERGARRMHPAFWAYFILVTKLRGPLG